MAKTLKLIEKIIDHKAFRPVAIVILTSFVLFNGLCRDKQRLVARAPLQRSRQE